MAEYTIREISEMFHLPPSTLRYYEDMGILTNVARTASGQRIYHDGHVSRLRTICCFKNTGMSIAQLQTFFTYASAETEHLEDILILLNSQKESILEQMQRLQASYDHILKKLHYYGDIKKCLDANQPLPEWKDYKVKPHMNKFTCFHCRFRRRILMSADSPVD